MKIRLGYVAMAIDLKDASPSKTVTYTQLKKIEDKEVKLYKLKKIAKKNLYNTKRILLYNKTHNIKVYRLTSKLIPLVTHQDVLDWDYKNEFKDLYNEITNLIKENNFRVSAHPDHFTILSTPRKKVLKNSIKDLVYHNNIMSSMGLTPEEGKLVLHIGGKYESKKNTIKRFIRNYKELNDNIKHRLILENDDKIYDTIDVLEICQELNAPMAFDIHHQWCNNRNENIEDYLEAIFNTWNDEILIPKVHLSSPKSKKSYRAHADNIDFDFFMDFIQKAKKLDRDFDIMIEAKNKNFALFDLMDKIKKNSDFKIIDNASFEY